MIHWDMNLIREVVREAYGVEINEESGQQLSAYIASGEAILNAVNETIKISPSGMTHQVGPYLNGRTAGIALAISRLKAEGRHTKAAVDALYKLLKQEAGSR